MSERDYIAQAKAAINGADQSPETIAAVVIAQALDRASAALQSNTESLDNLGHAVRIADENAWRMAQNR